jgi:hypothetical protein
MCGLLDQPGTAAAGSRAAGIQNQFKTIATPTLSAQPMAASRGVARFRTDLEKHVIVVSLENRGYQRVSKDNEGASLVAFCF